MEMDGDELRLDGNAAGGLLTEVFAFEMTTAEILCAGCDTLAPVGAAMVYAHGMGTIVRCAGCDTPLIRVAHVRDRYWLDLAGTRSLRIAAGA